MAQNEPRFDSQSHSDDHEQNSQARSSSDISHLLNDPLMLQKLGDRVYYLYVEELHKHHERSRDYGGSF